VADPVVYASHAEFYTWGLAPEVVAAAERKSPGILDRALASASRRADSCFRDRYVLPLASWGDEVRERVCQLAALAVLGVLGFNPDGPDRFYVDRARDAEVWFRRVADKKEQPDVVEGGPPVDGAVVVSPRERGWAQHDGLCERRGWE
jgi:hypothetical protein